MEEDAAFYVPCHFPILPDFGQARTTFDDSKWIGKGLQHFQDLGGLKRQVNVAQVTTKLGIEGTDGSMIHQINQVASLIKRERDDGMSLSLKV